MIKLQRVGSPDMWINGTSGWMMVPIVDIHVDNYNPLVAWLHGFMDIYHPIVCITFLELLYEGFMVAWHVCMDFIDTTWWCG